MKKTIPKEVRAIGMVWYRQEDYAKVMKIMEDSRKLPATYEKWLKSANAGFNKFSADGHIVEKAYLDPETFLEWCISRGLNVDAHARMQFANEFVFGKYRNQS